MGPLASPGSLFDVFLSICESPFDSHPASAKRKQLKSDVVDGKVETWSMCKHKQWFNGNLHTVVSSCSCVRYLLVYQLCGVSYTALLIVLHSVLYNAITSVERNYFTSALPFAN